MAITNKQHGNNKQTTCEADKEHGNNRQTIWQ